MLSLPHIYASRRGGHNPWMGQKKNRCASNWEYFYPINVDDLHYVEYGIWNGDESFVYIARPLCLPHMRERVTGPYVCPKHKSDRSPHLYFVYKKIHVMWKSTTRHLLFGVLVWTNIPFLFKNSI